MQVLFRFALDLDHFAGALIAGLEILVPGVFLLWIGFGALAVGLALMVAPELSFAWQMLLFAMAMLSSLGLGFAVQRRGRVEGAPMLNQDLAGHDRATLCGAFGFRGRARAYPRRRYQLRRRQ